MKSAAWRAPGGPSEAEPGADARPAAPRRGAALIQYGLIRQRPSAESERQVGEALNGARCPGASKFLGVLGGGGVADDFGTSDPDSADAVRAHRNDGAGARFGAVRLKDIFEQVRQGLEVAGRVGAGREDVLDVVGQVVAVQEGGDRGCGPAADDAGRAAGVPAGSQGLVDVPGWMGTVGGDDLQAAQLTVGLVRCGLIGLGGPCQHGERVPRRGDRCRDLSLNKRAQLVGGVCRHGVAEGAAGAVELKDQVPRPGQNHIEAGVRQLCRSVAVGLGGAGDLEQREELAEQWFGGGDDGAGLEDVGGAVGIGDCGAGLAGDDDARSHVPGRVGESDTGVQSAVSDPGQVDGRGAKHPDPVHPRGQGDGGGQAGLVLPPGFGAGGIVANCDDGIAQARGGAGGQAAIAGPRAVSFGRVVPLAQERRLDNAQDWAAIAQQRERHRAQRQPVRVVRGTVDRVKGPQPAGCRVGAAFFLAEKPDVGGGGGEERPDFSFDGEVDVGDQVAVGFLGDGGRPGADEVGGGGRGLERDGQ